MSAKKVTKAQPVPVVSQSAPVKEEPKKVTKVTKPAVQKPVESAPVTKSSEKSTNSDEKSKKGKSKAEPKPVEAKPVEAKPVEAKPVEQPVPEQKAKKAPKTKESTPVVTQPTPVPIVESKAKKAPKAKVAPVVAQPTPAPEVKKGGKSKAKAPEATPAPTEKKAKKQPKAKEAKPVKTPETTEVPASDKSERVDGKRYFKYQKDDEPPKGKYLAKKPKQAAVKAFSTISKNIRKSATDDSFLNVENKFYIAEYKGKGKIAKLIPYIGTIRLLPVPIEVPIRDKNKQPIMVTRGDGVMEQKKIVYKFDNHVVRDRSQGKQVAVPTTTETVTESSAHTLVQ